MSREHPCPNCGQATLGAYSEGGLRWAICEDCMVQRRKTYEEEAKYLAWELDQDRRYREALDRGELG